MTIAITSPQLKRLQILYGQYERHTLDTDSGRTGRLSWASSCVGRQIGSFKDLSLDEAVKLIDGLQRVLGVALPEKKPRQRSTQRDAQKAGTEGRSDQAHVETTMVSDADIRRIQRDLQQLGWDQARLDRFLASSRGPNNHRTAIRTLGDANRVHWALKRMIVRQPKPGEASMPGENSASVPF